MLRLEMLPARHGDCLLIEYGPEDAPRRVLIDGGTPASLAAVDGRLRDIAAASGDEKVALEVLVVTHVDEDHIGGTLAQLVHAGRRIAPKDVWFNGHKHLFPPDVLGPAQGEGLSTAIERARFQWNEAFAERELSVVVPDAGPLPVVKLMGGAKITLLSPTWRKLERLRTKWVEACKAAKLIPGEGAEPEDVLGKRDPPEDLDEVKVEELAASRFKQDGSAANGSSIAFLFEHDGLTLLLTGDAHPDALLASLERHQRGVVAVDAWKMSHHGSRANLSPKLLAKVQTDRFLFSTDSGTFGHPDPEAVARVVARRRPGTKLYFNYDTDYTRPWSDASLCETFGYEAFYPEDTDGHLVLELA